MSSSVQAVPSVECHSALGWYRSPVDRPQPGVRGEHRGEPVVLELEDPLPHRSRTTHDDFGRFFPGVDGGRRCAGYGEA